MTPAEKPPRRYYPLLTLTMARIREFLREPGAVFWSYVFPLVLAIALGVAFRNRPASSFRIAVGKGAGAEAVAAALNGDSRFHAAVCSEAEGRVQLRTGRADAIVAVLGQSPPRYEYSYDPTRTESVLARNAADDFLQRAAGRRDPAAVEDQLVDEPGGRYIDFLVPGLLGMGLMGGGLWGVGFGIVEMRIRKLLKRYVATPMKRSHFLTSILISRLLFTFTEGLFLLIFARLVFGVASQGSYWAIAFLILLGSLVFAGLGLLLACRARTINTISGLINAATLPMWIGSGLFFSTERFPNAVQPLLKAIPLTPLIHAMRSVMLEGTSIFALGLDVAIVAAWGCVSFVLALRWFRWN